MLNIYHSPGMWPRRFQLWWVAATFLPQEVYPYSFSFFFFPPPPCPDSAFQHGQWLRHQPKSLSWNTLTCHMCHCNWTWGFPGLTVYFQRLSYIKWNLSSSVPPHIRPFWILFFFFSLIIYYIFFCPLLLCFCAKSERCIYVFGYSK